MCQEGREGEGSQDSGFAALIGTSEKGMTLTGTEFHREGFALRGRDMKIRCAMKMKDGFRGGDPLNGTDLGVMIQFDANL
jgi:hypothetical protein